MPSKANKRLAAAQKSQAKAAAEALNAPEESSVPVSTTASSNAPITDAPITTTNLLATQLPKLAIRSESEDTVLSTSTTPSKDPDFDDYAPLPPSSKLKPLSKGTEKVTTNCYPLIINSQTLFRYDVKVTKEDDRPESSAKPNLPAMTGSKGGSRKRQELCSDIVLLALQKLRVVEPYAYDGAAMLHVVNKIDNKKDCVVVHIEDKELEEDLRKAHFAKFAGRFVVGFSLNSRESKCNMQDIFAEDLKNMTSGDKSLTAVLQILLVQEAKKSKKFTVLDGGSQVYSNIEKKPVGIPKGVVERDGLGAGCKIVVGKTGQSEVIIVLEYKKTHFFERVPASILYELAKKVGLEKFYRGMKLETVYSSQTFSADGVSSLPIGKLTALGKPTSVLCSEASGVHVSKFNLELPAIEKTFKTTKTKYHFAMETVQPLPNQKLGPHHGQPPRCAFPNDRFRLTESVGRDAFILSANATLEAFGVAVKPSAITLLATKVDVPYIEYANKVVHPDVNKNTSWQCNKFVEAARCNKLIIAFNGEKEPRAREIVQRVKDGLMSTAESLGVKINDYIVEDLTGSADYVKTKLIKKLDDMQILAKTQKVHLIFIDCKDAPTHGILKIKERRTGVSTQQMNFGKSAKLNTGRHTFTNILLKMNLKLGGQNHRVKPRESIKHLWGAGSNTLIISYDVCHPGASEPSVVGFAYNVSADRQKITGDFHYQNPRQEKVESDILERRAQSILETYMKAHDNKPPTNVIILRDGVSEGQYRMVLGHEVVAIEKGFAVSLEKRKLKMPSVAVIVATKRHANRLFVDNGKGMENVAPFLAVDHTIVRKDANEILFVSHCPLGGTSQPLLLNVLKNEQVFKSNLEIVDLMSALCAAHQASLNTISLPETIYAADEYAKRGADMFAALHLCDLQPPRTERGHIDYEELTRRLCYDASSLKGRRMA